MNIVTHLPFVGLMLLTLPFIVYPKQCARMRFRHAKNPEPEPQAVLEMRLTGLIIAGFIVVLWVTATFA